MVDPVFLGETAPPRLQHPQSRTPDRRCDTDRGSADALVDSYHYLCRRGARKFLRTGLERSDLEQVAALGLIKASRRYDPTLRTPFEAYAWLMIVGELMHYVRDHETIVRVPRRLRSLERAFNEAHDALVAALGREPSDRELAHAMGVLDRTVADVRRLRESAIPLALDDIVGVQHPSEIDLEDRLLVGRAVGTLDPTARRIIVGVYVLRLTQLEIGRRLGLSPKRVSRLHHAALARMQAAWAS